MANLNPRQFSMVTNIKAAPGSQGTLFQGGNPSPARGGQPWPRAYNPERRGQVTDALGMTDARSQIVLTPNRGKPTPTRVVQPEVRRDTFQGVETIARSTVPIEHIQGLEAEFGTTRAEGRERGGTYYSGVRGFDVTRGYAQSKVPIHEIGHHVSYTQGTEHSTYETAAQRGQEEGFAENYAETHYRDHRGRPLVNFETSPGGWQKWNADVDHHVFANAFGREREKSPSAQRRREQNAAMARPSSPSGIVGQQPLLHRVTEQSREYINARGDRGPDKVYWSYANLDADPKSMTSHPWRTKTTN